MNYEELLSLLLNLIFGGTNMAVTRIYYLWSKKTIMYDTASSCTVPSILC
jgi:predicted transglutaminase-like protease